MASWKNPGEIEKLASRHMPIETTTLWISEIMADLEGRDGPTIFINLIERMASTLTNPDNSIRVQGVNFLSTLICERCERSPTSLDPKEFNAIAQFYCDRIKDHHDIIPGVLKGIYALSFQKNLQSDMALKIIHELFQHVSCQTQTNEDRLLYYKIINQLFNCFLENVIKIGPDFIYGLLTSVQGERNPINLNFLFQILPNIFAKMPLGHLTEEAFDIVACYFPIDFNPNFTKTPSVTRDSLAKGLADCLTANPNFGEFCYPLLHDKLSTTLRLAILDSFYVLQISASKFPVEYFNTHFYEIWDHLKESLFPGNDLEIREIASQTTATLIIYYFDSQLLENIILTCRSFLSRVDLSLFQPAERLLTCLAKASPKACTKILMEFLPQLTNELEKNSTDTQSRSNIFYTIGNFLEAAALHKISGPWPKVIYCLVKETSLSDLAWRPLSFCCNNVNKEERLEIYKALKERIGSSTEANKCLKSFAEIYPNEVLESLIKPIIEHIKIEDHLTEKYILGITSLAIQEPFTSSILHQILDTSFSSKFGLTALQSLTILASNPESLHAMKFLNNNCKAISRFVDFYQTWDISDKENCNSLENIQAAAKLLDLIVAAQSQDIHQQIVEEYSIKYMYNEIQIPIIILESIYNSLSNKIIIPEIYSLTTKLVNISLDSKENLFCTSCCKLIATLINKYSNIKIHLYLLMFKDIVKGDYITHYEINTVKTLTWITKCLFVKGSSEANEWLDVLLSLMNNEELSKYASKGFQILMDYSPRVLSFENNCKVRLLYRQRIFEACIDMLIKNSPIYSSPHLLALAYLVQGISESLLIHNLDTLISPIQQVLEIENEPETLIPILECLNGLLKTLDVKLERHLKALANRCIRLTNNSSMTVRIKSLETISLITKYPAHLLLIFKHDVLYGVKRALDDPKRLVRRQAVNTRALWFLVGAEL